MNNLALFSMYLLGSQFTLFWRLTGWHLCDSVVQARHGSASVPRPGGPCLPSEKGWPHVPCLKEVTCPCMCTLDGVPCHGSTRKPWTFGNHSLSLWHHCQQLGLLVVNCSGRPFEIWAHSLLLSQIYHPHLVPKNDFSSHLEIAWSFYPNVQIFAVFSFLDRQFYFTTIQICPCIASVYLKWTFGGKHARCVSMTCPSG